MLTRDEVRRDHGGTDSAAGDDRSVRILDPDTAVSLVSVPVHVAQAVCETDGTLVAVSPPESSQSS